MARLSKLLAAAAALGGAAFAVIRRRQASTPDAPAAAAPAAAADTGDAPEPRTAPPGSAPGTPPPPETPGPSVTAIHDPESDVQRAEEADATTPDMELLRERAGGPVDELVEAETAAAAAEAAGIGGPMPADEADLDPAMRPLSESGEGEAEGFELAEQDLIDNASHGGGRGNPLRDAPTPEAESDLTTAAYGDPDEEIKDPDTLERPEDEDEK